MEVACERSYCNFKIPFKKIHITGRIQVSSPFLTICNEINILAPYVLFDFPVYFTVIRNLQFINVFMFLL